jgi:protein gp37
MNKTKIEMYDYTINPVKGLCPVACSYCFARRLYKRFKWNPEIRFDASVLDDIEQIPVGSKVFVGSTMELFGEWVEEHVLSMIFDACGNCYPDRTFIFLTKQPQNLIKWSPFPENCWVGRTVTSDCDFRRDADLFEKVKAKVKFISFEPLLEWQLKPDWDIENSCVIRRLDGIDWIIIGQQWPAATKTQPKIEWIQEIVEAADKAGVPVFLKENLRSMLPLPQKIFCTVHATGVRWMRQEFPKLK